MRFTRKLFVIFLLLATLSACRSKRETTFLWKGGDESRTLTFIDDNTFVLEINGGYFFRRDTGVYIMKGDTLVLNPDKVGNEVDSLVEMDSLFNGQRFFEVMEEVIEFGMNNEVIESFYRPRIFPQVILNDTLTLTISPDDPTFRKLLIPDDLVVHRAKILLQEENTCKPTTHLTLMLPLHDQPVNSYRVFVRSRSNKENYMAGFKWLIKGDTIELFFKNENCEPTDVKLVRLKRQS